MKSFLILVILGDAGGPQGVAMVPGRYMFRSAFVDGAAGKGCAIGLILFVKGIGAGAVKG